MEHEIIVNEEQKAYFSLPYEFPIWVYETDLSRKPMGVNNWHWHDELQFCVVTSGKIFMTVQEKKFVMSEGDGLFINAGFLHRSQSDGGTEAKYLCMNIHPSLLACFHGSVMEQKYVLPYLQDKGMHAVALKKSVPWQYEIIKSICRISEIMKAEEWGYELEVFEAAVRLWKLLILNAAQANAAVPGIFRRTEMKIILSYIHEHYREAISLEDIAALIHMSKSGCCRIFKRALNCTIFDYLTDYRIRKSIRCLEESDASVTEIAYEVGFFGTSYYIKQFRKRMGMTPAIYRKEFHRRCQVTKNDKSTAAVEGCLQTRKR